MGRSTWGKIQRLIGQKSTGQLATVLRVVNPKKRVDCYGRQIKDGVIFSRLNLSTGWSVRSKEKQDLPRTMGGFYTLLSDLDPEGDSDDCFVAISGVKPDPTTEVNFFHVS